MLSTLLIGALVMMQQATAVVGSEVTSKAILGVEVGMTLADARDRLRPLGRSEAREVTAGMKQVWKLDRTGFEWVALRSDAEGRVVWITGHRRAGQELPFDAIGLAPRTATEDTAIWNVEGTFSGQRLTLRGAKRRAQVVTLVAVKP
jgi:hypothetical protein